MTPIGRARLLFGVALAAMIAWLAFLAVVAYGR
jgi:hypothetical protein